MKQFAFSFAEDGCLVFLEENPVDALRSLGYEDKFIAKKLDNRELFRMGIWARNYTVAKQATWDGIFDLVKSSFPEVAPIVLRHADALKTRSFDDIEAEAKAGFLRGASYFDINEAAVKGFSPDERYVTAERLLASKGGLPEVRGFLYNRMGLSRLFDGKGYTKNEVTSIHLKEFLVRNCAVDSIPGFRYVDLKIDRDELEC